LEIEDEADAHLLDADQFSASNNNAIDQAVRECSVDTWWNYPEAVVWVMSSSVRDVATTRAWLRYCEANGRTIESGYLAAFLGTPAAEEAMVHLENAARGEGEKCVRSQGWDSTNNLKAIPSSDWSGRKVHLVSGFGVLAPVNDHRFARYRDLLLNREDLQIAFPSDAASGISQTSKPVADNADPGVVRLRVSQERIEHWFREVRCPEFEGMRPPNESQCLAAAKAHFSPDNAVRAVVRAARQNATPPHWRTTGPNRKPA
jgi:hypothetical protein